MNEEVEHRCDDCGAYFDAIEYDQDCPECGSENVSLTGG